MKKKIENMRKNEKKKKKKRATDQVIGSNQDLIYDDFRVILDHIAYYDISSSILCSILNKKQNTIYHKTYILKANFTVEKNIFALKKQRPDAAIENRIS